MNNNFINEFISLGMDSYFNNKHENFFENHIVECLCEIYGKETIFNIYKEKNEDKFAEVLTSYGFSLSNYYAFLEHIDKFEKFKAESLINPNIKSDIAHIVESDVITMFLYKCLVCQVSSDEISHFENYFLNNFNVIKLHFNFSTNPNQTRDLWEKKKRLMIDNIELVEIKPEYLDKEVYSKYGTNIEEVKKMDYRMVEQLNSYIKQKMVLDEQSQKDNSKKIPLSNIVITSGNGFVDALLIASVIITELCAGIIYLFLHL